MPYEKEEQELDLYNIDLINTGIVVKDRLFMTFLDLRSVAQRVLHRGHRDLDGGEYSFMLCVFCRHPDFLEKNVWSLSRIYISSAPEPYQEYDCFWVERTDGSIIDISYNKCVNSENTSMIQFIKASMHAIQPNLQEFIEQEFVDSIRCPLSGLSLKRRDAVVEHFPRPLELILMSFIQENDIDIRAVEYDCEEVRARKGPWGRGQRVLRTCTWLPVGRRRM